MINLNGKEFEGNTIFNGGNAGLVRNVKISVEKKQAGSPDTYPEYKLIATSDAGGSVNQGFYYFKPNPSSPDEYNQKRERQELSRVLHIAKAVLGADYVFPEVKTTKEAVDVLFGLIKDNVEGKVFNVYVTYGTKNRPGRFLGLRYFNFIERAVENTRLIPNNMDLLTKITEDAPSNDGISGSDTIIGATEDWTESI